MRFNPVLFKDQLYFIKICKYKDLYTNIVYFYIYYILYIV